MTSARSSSVVWQSSRTIRTAKSTSSRWGSSSLLDSSFQAPLANLSWFFQASISKQKGALQKHAVIVKIEQKELQTATLELCMLFDLYRVWRVLMISLYLPCANIEQLQSDIEAANANVADAKTGIDKLRRELAKLQDQVTKEEVRSIS